MWIVGIDLAWGEKNPDGVCVLQIDQKKVDLHHLDYPKGDEALLEVLASYLEQGEDVFVVIDAPVICTNEEGSRPVDREMHRIFGRQHAGCHPVNRKLCSRALRVVEKIRQSRSRSCRLLSSEEGFPLVHGLPWLVEVYPHAALVRLLNLERIIKYKKGPVAGKRSEFKRLQTLLLQDLPRLFPELRVESEIRTLLDQPWSKPVEDRTDALICALIGLWHWRHQGGKSLVVGDEQTGFIVVPEIP